MQSVKNLLLCKHYVKALFLGGRRGSEVGGPTVPGAKGGRDLFLPSMVQGCKEKLKRATRVHRCPQQGFGDDIRTMVFALGRSWGGLGWSWGGLGAVFGGLGLVLGGLGAVLEPLGHS